jgi:hypothetical protein
MRETLFKGFLWLIWLLAAIATVAIIYYLFVKPFIYVKEKIAGTNK